MKQTTSIRLRQLIDERNLKQADVIELCAPYCKEFNVKINKSDLSQYCSGKITPKQDKLTVLSLALNVNEAWLMGYDVPADRSASASVVPLLNSLTPEQQQLVDLFKAAPPALQQAALAVLRSAEK